MKLFTWVPVLAFLIPIGSYAQAGSQGPLVLQTRTSLQQEKNIGVASGAVADSALPDSPGASSDQQPKESNPKPTPPDPCVVSKPPHTFAAEAASAEEARKPCSPQQNPYKRFLDNGKPIPLTPRQKGYLAVHDVIDPFNLLTIIANSAFTIGINSHTAYGPGMRGFGLNIGYSFSQDVTGEFIGTFGVCSLLHEDPHYHRMPNGTPFHRVVHAISRTVIAQHDDGTPMPNYENFITYPASAEISNLYVPGIHGDGPSTVARILTGLATDPVNNIITEFLPDFAKRVHIRIVFVQQIINQVASSQPFP